MAPHPRLTGASVGAVLGATYAVPESALGADWAREEWCKPCWLTPRLPGQKKDNNKSATAAAAAAQDPSFCVGCVYVHDDGARWVHFPRGVGHALFGPPALDDRSEGEPVADGVEFVGRLLTTPVPQVQAVNAIVHALTQTRARMGCAVMRCGFGKTVCAVAVIARLRRKTAILVHTKQLAEQWRERIGAFMPAARVFMHNSGGASRSSSGSGRADAEAADVTVVIVQTAMRQETMTDVGLCARRFGLVIVDETHHIAARVYSRALRLFPAASVLGLTATPKRSDGLERFVYWLVGYPCFTALDSEYQEHTVATLARVALPPAALRAWPAHLRTSAGASAYAAAERVTDGMLAKLLSAVGNMDLFARVVARDILQKYSVGRNVLVMSTRRSQLMLLARWMRSAAARSGAIAHVARGLAAEFERSADARVRLEVTIDGATALAPPLPDLDALVRAAGARISARGAVERIVSSNTTAASEAPQMLDPKEVARELTRRNKRARPGQQQQPSDREQDLDLVVRVRALRIDHGIGGDLCVGVVPDADNLLVVVKDWTKLQIVSSTEKLKQQGEGEDEDDDDDDEDDNDHRPAAGKKRAGRASAAAAADDDDDDDDEDETGAPRVARAGQRLRSYCKVRFPPRLQRARDARTEAQITDREVLHGACGLHRDSERALRSYLYAYGVLRVRRQLPRALVDRVLALACPVVRVGFCVGAMAAERWKPQLDCGILLSTSQQCAEGFDDPKRDTLVMTLPPRGNLKQLFGRVQRPCPVKARPTRLVLYHLQETDPVFGRKVAQWCGAVQRDGFERARDETISVDMNGVVLERPF